MGLILLGKNKQLNGLFAFLCLDNDDLVAYEMIASMPGKCKVWKCHLF